MPSRAAGLTLALLLGLAPGTARATDLQMAWDPNAEPDLAGYRVYYGTSATPPYDGTFATQGPSPIDLPLSSLADRSQPEIMLSFPPCMQVYIAVTAYNTAGVESDFSNVVSTSTAPLVANLAARTEDPGTVVLTWDPIPNAAPGVIATYRMDYALHTGTPYDGTGATQGGSPVSVAASAIPTAPSYTLAGLPASTALFFAVEVLCADGAGAGPSREVAVCTASDACHLGAPYDLATSLCASQFTKPNGAPCQTGTCNAKTCQAGVCTSTTAVCPAVDQCHLPGTCSGSACSAPLAPDTTTCDDRDACTTGDQCTAGVCAGSPKTCTPADSCHKAKCNPATGACLQTVRADDEWCTDHNPCTLTDLCQGGTCVGSNPVVCPAPDECHLAGTCNQGTGACVFAVKPDHTPCTAGECLGGTCLAGVDAGTPADAAAPKPDAAAGPDAAGSKPDAAAAGPDAAVSKPDAAAAGPDAAVSKPDAAAAGPDASRPPDAAASGEDAAAAADAAPVPPDASENDAAADTPDSAQPEPDAALLADASAAVDARVPDATSSAPEVVGAGCACTSLGGAPWPLVGLLLAGRLLRRRRTTRTG